mmetsp:Transcript_6038/g.13943  ORF Transcript_6038/g.13943 Transcript_6038/m.13943 type:complete len:347 (+) Transcript_6038:221-1261(+)
MIHNLHLDHSDYVNLPFIRRDEFLCIFCGIFLLDLKDLLVSAQLLTLQLLCFVRLFCFVLLLAEVCQFHLPFDQLGMRVFLQFQSFRFGFINHLAASSDVIKHIFQNLRYFFGLTVHRQRCDSGQARRGHAGLLGEQLELIDLGNKLRLGLRQVLPIRVGDSGLRIFDAVSTPSCNTAICCVHIMENADQSHDLSDQSFFVRQLLAFARVFGNHVVVVYNCLLVCSPVLLILVLRVLHPFVCLLFLLHPQAVVSLGRQPGIKSIFPLILDLSESDVKRELFSSQLLEELVKLLDDHILLHAQVRFALQLGLVGWACRREHLSPGLSDFQHDGVLLPGVDELAHLSC